MSHCCPLGSRLRPSPHIHRQVWLVPADQTLVDAFAAQQAVRLALVPSVFQVYYLSVTHGVARRACAADPWVFRYDMFSTNAHFNIFRGWCSDVKRYAALRPLDSGLPMFAPIPRVDIEASRPAGGSSKRELCVGYSTLSNVNANRSFQVC